MLLTNIYAVNKYVIIVILIHGIIDQNGMPRVCMESLMPFFMWSYENLEAACLFLVKVCGYQMSLWDVFYLNSSKISPQTDACWIHNYYKCTYSNTQESVVWLKWNVTTGQPFSRQEMGCMIMSTLHDHYTHFCGVRDIIYNHNYTITTL